MASYDDDRRELYDLLEAGLGSRGAGLLMAQLPAVAWTELATKADLAGLRSELKGDMAGLRSELKGDMAELKVEMAELKVEMAALRTELKSDVAALEVKIGELRAETKHELASVKTSMQVTVFGSMIGLAGLVFAVASFAR